ncbi:MAG TPA: rhodanese-like domain-containing protein [Verrucomicrobiae bacterium]|nr:rhodanese-like domain-containing protein [Verrucomicrobiae bacterium]
MKTNCSLLTLALFILVSLGAATARADQKTNATTVATVVTNVQADVAAKLVAEGKVTVLDVRTPEEFAEGHIAGATNINFMGKDFAAQIAKLDTNKVYLVHCASGGRSRRCLPQLKQLGLKQIYHFDGGFSAWEDAGKPVAK